MRELIVDANVLVRFLVQDVPQQAKAARKLIEQAESGALLLDRFGDVKRFEPTA